MGRGCDGDRGDYDLVKLISGEIYSRGSHMGFSFVLKYL